MTLKQLAAHPEFVAFAECWRDIGRAPLPLADWVHERLGEKYAAGVVWAATEVRRRRYDWIHHRSEAFVGGLTPSQYNDLTWRWYSGFHFYVGLDDIPKDIYDRMAVSGEKYPTFAHAVAALILAYPEPAT